MSKRKREVDRVTLYECAHGHAHSEEDVECLPGGHYCCPFDDDADAHPVEYVRIQEEMRGFTVKEEDFGDFFKGLDAEKVELDMGLAAIADMFKGLRKNGLSVDEAATLTIEMIASLNKGKI